ncbi:HNH endonuclease signature motif containing protein [Luteimicrobium album]|uniref:HNH endonuclease signature motif containing protein n=1 Tax=Luteimicrobium album TaxID=1054550 RepID=UPI0024E13E6C|nr:HNH endonuclease signature motif containing protein [Luteimicrobium album]
MSDEALIEVVAAAERLRSWALGAQVTAVAELTARAGGSSVAVDGVGAQVAARLCVTGRAADLLVDLAAGLGELPEVADALMDGRVDERRARVLVDAVVDVPQQDRRDLIAPLVGTRAVPGPACRLTGPRLRDRVRRVVAAHDPTGANRRRERVRGTRCVRFEPAGDAMAYLTALLPADDAARVRAHLDALSVPTHRMPDEARSLDQVRADTLVALLTGSRPALGDDAGEPCDSGQVRGAGRAVTGDPVGVHAGRPSSAAVAAWTPPSVRTVVHVTVAASTLLGADDAPGDLAGFGPIAAELARELASAGGPSGGDVTWQRILTDPVTGAATDVSRRTYRPGVVLGDLVRTRDATCTFPGCRVPASRCDLDHVEPFDHRRAEAGRNVRGNDGGDGRGAAGPRPPGQTRADNLHPVCRRHHNLKTHHGWSTTRDPMTGTVTWTTPSGHVHEVGAHVTDLARLDDDFSAAPGDGGVAGSDTRQSGPWTEGRARTSHGVRTRRPSPSSDRRSTERRPAERPTNKDQATESPSDRQPDDEPPF